MASESTNPDLALAAVRDDFVALKRDVASMIEHIKGGAMNKIQNAAEQPDRVAHHFFNESGVERGESSQIAECAAGLGDVAKGTVEVSAEPDENQRIFAMAAILAAPV